MHRLFRIFSLIVLALAIAGNKPLFFRKVAAGIAASPNMAPSGFVSPGHASQVVTVSTSTMGASMRYTTDGSSPTFSTGTLIASTSGTVTAAANVSTTIKAVAFTTGSDVSTIATNTYDFSTPLAHTPTMSPVGFVSIGHATQTVTISTTTGGANIRYTKDGSAPTYSHGTLISASSGSTTVPGSATTELKAVAFTTSADVSPVADEVYEFSNQ